MSNIQIIANPAFGWQPEAIQWLAKPKPGNMGIFTPPGTGKTTVPIKAFEIFGRGIYALPDTTLCDEKYYELCDHFGRHKVARGYRDVPLNVREFKSCLLYTSPSPRDQRGSRMPSSA